MEFRFSNGDKVKDRISGLTGIVTARADHLFGCNRYWLQPQELKDGKAVDGQWQDEDALELVDEAAIKPRRYRVYEDDPLPVPVRRAGGPTSQPSSQTRQTTK